MKLTIENYNKGFLVDEETIAGVTEMAGGVYACYVSHYLTGETLAYEEFEALEPALSFLDKMNRPWSYEAVGCSKTTKKGTSGGCSACPSNSNSNSKCGCG